MDINTISSSELAYFGDSVIELIAREYMIKSGISGVGNLNKEAMKYVRATSQSLAVENILPLLTQTELAVFKRARNNNSVSIPKSASACEYRRATGLEALFAMLWLTECKERAYELFYAAYKINETDKIEKIDICQISE